MTHNEFPQRIGPEPTVCALTVFQGKGARLSLSLVGGSQSWVCCVC